MNNSSKSIFFLRHYNDLDHITPIIWYFNKNRSDVKIQLFLFKEELFNDFRINFLLNFSQIEVLIIPQILDFNYTHKNSSEFFERYIKKENVTLICFDWLMETSGAILEFAFSLAKKCTKHNIPIISLPHGDSPHSNKLIFINDYTIDATDIYSPGKIFDCVVVPNKLCQERYINHLPKGKTPILGSARYNDEWIKQLNNIIPNKQYFEKPNSFKITFFLRSPYFPIFWDELFRTVEMLSMIEDVEIGLVGHTRIGIADISEICSIMELNYKENVHIFESNSYSFRVTKESDLVIDLACSATFDAILLDKNVLSLEYLHATSSVISDYFPEAIVNNRDVLLEKIYQFKKSTESNLKKTNVLTFIQEFLGANNNSKVLEKYVDILNSTSVRSGKSFANTCKKQSNNKKKDCLLLDQLLKANNKNKDYQTLLNLSINKVSCKKKIIQEIHQRLQEKIQKIELKNNKIQSLRESYFSEKSKNTALKNALLQSRIESANNKFKSIFLYGSGKHTKLLFEVVPPEFLSNVKGIIDDQPIDDYCNEYPIVSYKYAENADCIILSTDRFQKQMLNKLRPHSFKGEIIDLYKGL